MENNFKDIVIETKDLILRKAVFDDYMDIYQNLWRHEESARYMFWNITESIEDAISRMERTIDFQKSHKYALFVYEKKTDKAIGFAGMMEIEPGVYEETGIAIGPDFVHKGYGTQILNVLVDEAKKEGAHKIMAACRIENEASHKMQMKCGFHFSHYKKVIDQRDNKEYTLEYNEKDI